MVTKYLLWGLTVPLVAGACNNDGHTDVSEDSGSDADTDADIDADADTDGDSDADTDADGDVDTDSCPEEDYQAGHLATGAGHTCAVLEGGGLKCWGYDGDTSLGVPSPLGYPMEEEVCAGDTPATCPFVDVGGPVARITAGGGHTCALLESGGVKCWGWNGGGMYPCGNILGYGDDYDDCGACEVPSDWGTLDLGGTAEKIAAYGTHSSALMSDGNVRTWGCSIQMQSDLSDHHQLDFGGAAVQVTTGEDHHCALLEDGDVYCWGYNSQGQLGYGHTDFVAASQVPDQVGPVELGEPAVQVAAGGYHSCAILEGGDVVCWGWNESGGQLGYGNTENVGDDELPVYVGTVDVGGEVVQVSLGETSTCAVLSDGSLKCWGIWSYEAGECVGDDESPADVDPIDVGDPVTRVSAGGSHICAVMSSGAIRCWGSNSYGQLGYGDAVSEDEYIGDDEPPASVGDVPVM